MTIVRRLSRLALYSSMLLTLAPSPASGQPDPNGPDPSKVRVRFGPIMLNPSITVGNVGVDENVFNESINAKRDFTATISPRSEIYMRFLGTWFTGVVNEDIVWYQRYSSERQSNSTYGLAWKWPLSRLVVNASATRMNTRERMGYEIDARAERAQNVFTAGATFRFLVNTGIELAARRDTTNYDGSAQFNNVNLGGELALRGTTLTVGLVQRLTPLTTASFAISRREDRFPFNPIRDSDRTEARLSLAFDPVALLKGTLSVGYTNFQPRSPTFPKYTGATLAASLTYVLLEVTRFTVTADRQVQDSYDINQPYYVQTGVGLDIAQQIFGQVDAVARVGIESLAYRDRSDVVVDFAARTDHVIRYGGGIGYHLGKNLRLGINIDQFQRTSVIDSRAYTRPLIGTSLTYDF